MEWISNTVDPKIATPAHMNPILGQTDLEAFLAWRNWLSDKIIGEPKASDEYTVAQLKSKNVVGVYMACISIDPN